MASPWPRAVTETANTSNGNRQSLIAGMEMPPAEILANTGITKLEAEPQEGPTEYKLHLLLRPRRSFTAASTVQRVSGSFLSKSRTPRSHSETDLKPGSPAPVLAPSSQSRQNRLQHLTTQLLWRLQQSSRYHSSSKSDLVLPILPEADVALSAFKGPGPLIPGLEESNGALYEIGVSDDGTFVGLARDELEESLTVLRAMAFSLGCDVQIIRLMIAGDCQWDEETQTQKTLIKMLHTDKLWVAEVLVSPHLGSNQLVTEVSASLLDQNSAVSSSIKENSSQGISRTALQSEQLRVSLTGSTTSGKSSLLGTLSTSTLDNGRGKSRLSLLKHRHEIVSGVTSSLAQELFGYRNLASCNDASAVNVINYASGNVSSWNDIHAATEQGRLVFVTDSAGHPRYRRTTVRGLVSWAPHWTLCCIAADDEEDSSGKTGATASSSEILGSAGHGVDLSRAHLELCLKLNLQLVIVITKLDIATKTGVRSTLAKVLTILKSAGRQPVILPSPSTSVDGAQLQSITNDDVQAVGRAIASVAQNDMHLLVPIVLTSAVTGSGIARLHALLGQLPLPSRSTDDDDSTSRARKRPQCLFHVDEVFAMPPNARTTSNEGASSGTVLSGYLRYGQLEVGGKLFIGPCLTEATGEVRSSPEIHRASSYPGLTKGSPRAVTLSYDRQRPSSGDFTDTVGETDEPSTDAQTWQEVRVTSLRNLRLPVQRLSAGQVGTVGIALFDAPPGAIDIHSNTSSYIRRGMVIIPTSKDHKASPPPAYSRFSAVFPEASLPAWPGVLVVVYIASIRASAKIVEVKALEQPLPTRTITEEVFDFADNASDISRGTFPPDSPTDNQHTEITFEFATCREWIEVGTQVLVTPGGGPSLTGQPEQRDVSSAGLDGYVGTITLAMV